MCKSMLCFCNHLCSQSRLLVIINESIRYRLFAHTEWLFNGFFLWLTLSFIFQLQRSLLACLLDAILASHQYILFVFDVFFIIEMLLIFHNKRYMSTCILIRFQFQVLYWHSCYRLHIIL